MPERMGVDSAYQGGNLGSYSSVSAHKNLMMNIPRLVNELFSNTSPHLFSLRVVTHAHLFIGYFY